MGKKNKSSAASASLQVGSSGLGISKHRTSGHSGPNKLTKVLQTKEINA
jgi:hypothetical protein